MGKQLKVLKSDLDVTDNIQRIGFPYDDGLGNFVFDLDSHNKIMSSEFAVFLIRNATIKFFVDHGRHSDYPLTTLLGDHTEAWAEYLNKKIDPQSQLDRYIKQDLATLLDEDLYRLPFRPDLASIIDMDRKVFERVRDAFNQYGLTKSYSVRLKKLEALGFDSNAALRFAAESTLFLLENEITKTTPSHLSKCLFALQNIIDPTNVALKERFAKAGLKSIAEVLSTRKQNSPAKGEIERMIPELISMIPEADREDVLQDLKMHVLNVFGYDDIGQFKNSVVEKLQAEFEKPAERSQTIEASSPKVKRDLHQFVEEMLNHVDIETYTRDVVLPSLTSSSDDSTYFIDLLFTDAARLRKGGISYIRAVLAGLSEHPEPQKLIQGYKKVVESILLDPQAFHSNIKLQAEFIDYVPWEVVHELAKNDCLDVEIAGRLAASRIDGDLREHDGPIDSKEALLLVTQELMEQEFNQGVPRINFSNEKPVVKSKQGNLPIQKEGGSSKINEPTLPFR